mmetsp:Transcript_18777/g.38726  ORF Transcript_18777/g.38726 Transcript_18777/m.38726 type:complete len:113 (-) Transcript_18777:201-539(-)
MVFTLSSVKSANKSLLVPLTEEFVNSSISDSKSLHLLVELPLLFVQPSTIPFVAGNNGSLHLFSNIVGAFSFIFITSFNLRGDNFLEPRPIKSFFKASKPVQYCPQHSTKSV